jgi:sarcosine oxidase subunit gamma
MVESAVLGAATEFVSGLRPVSPAAHLAAQFAAAEVSGPRAVRIREVPFLTMVGLRAVRGTAAAHQIETRLGVSLPSACGAVATGEGVSVLWLSPDEYLGVSDKQPAELTSSLVEALENEPGSVIDLSANRTTLELSGPSARAVLEKGCPLDLHPREFTAGTAYVTLIGSVPVILWKVEEGTYRILPRSSFADFLGRWLLDAMAEFKAPEIP